MHFLILNMVYALSLTHLFFTFQSLFVFVLEALFLVAFRLFTPMIGLDDKLKVEQTTILAHFFFHKRLQIWIIT